MAAKKTSKSDFIRQQPKDMSVADVLAAGKAAGIKFGSSLVYMVRGPAGGTATPKKAAATTASSKKTGAKRAAKAGPRKSAKGTATPKTSTAKKTATVNKADFVRQHASLSPKEIVSKAKAAGIELGITYVYNVRGADKTAAKKTAAEKSTAASKTSTPPKTPPAITKPPGPNGTRSSGILGLCRGAAQGSCLGAGPWAGPGDPPGGAGSDQGGVGGLGVTRDGRRAKLGVAFTSPAAQCPVELENPRCGARI